MSLQRYFNFMRRESKKFVLKMLLFQWGKKREIKEKEFISNRGLGQ